MIPLPSNAKIPPTITPTPIPAGHPGLPQKGQVEDDIKYPVEPKNQDLHVEDLKNCFTFSNILIFHSLCSGQPAHRQFCYTFQDYFGKLRYNRHNIDDRLCRCILV
jgi:hypothetical protein